jgi:uncharacterized protein YutE (UPF0331/DUF86 family)
MIEQHIEVLNKVKEKGLIHYQSDLDTQLKAERALHVIIEACIDIANHIISVKALRRPKDYADVFKILGEANIINEELTTNLVNMARFRLDLCISIQV